MDKKFTHTLYYFTSAIMVIASLGLASSQSFRHYLNNSFFHNNTRSVLSVLNYHTKNHTYKVVKVKNNTGLFIEVYDVENKNISSFSLGRHLNGAIFLNGRATELASYDLDKDGQNEIIVPILGDNNQSLIYILKFNKANMNFKLESPISYIDQLEVR